MSKALQEFVARFTYAGVLAALLLGSLGVPIPEEMLRFAATFVARTLATSLWRTQRASEV